MLSYNLRKKQRVYTMTVNSKLGNTVSIVELFSGIDLVLGSIL